MPTLIKLGKVFRSISQDWRSVWTLQHCDCSTCRPSRGAHETISFHKDELGSAYRAGGSFRELTLMWSDCTLWDKVIFLKATHTHTHTFSFSSQRCNEGTQTHSVIPSLSELLSLLTRSKGGTSPTIWVWGYVGINLCTVAVQQEFDPGP